MNYTPTLHATFLELSRSPAAGSYMKAPQLHYAASNGQEQRILGLLQQGVDVNSRDEWSRTALHWAAEKGQLGVCRTLIEKGADLEACGGAGWTALHCAAYAGHQAIVQLLLDSGAKIEAKDCSGQTPQTVAASNSQLQVVRMLQGDGVSPDSGLQSPQANAPQTNALLQAPAFDQFISRPISAPPAAISLNYGYSSAMAALETQRTNQYIQQLNYQVHADMIRSVENSRIDRLRAREVHHRNYMNALFPDQYPYSYSYSRRYDDYGRR